MNNWDDERDRREFLSAFSNSDKPDRLNHWAWTVIVALVLAAVILTAVIGYAIGAGWGL